MCVQRKGVVVEGSVRHQLRDRPDILSLVRQVVLATTCWETGSCSAVVGADFIPFGFHILYCDLNPMTDHDASYQGKRCAKDFESLLQGHRD